MNHTEAYVTTDKDQALHNLLPNTADLLSAQGDVDSPQI